MKRINEQLIRRTENEFFFPFSNPLCSMHSLFSFNLLLASIQYTIYVYTHHAPFFFSKATFCAAVSCYVLIN